MASVYGSYGKLSDTVWSRVWAEYDYSSTADSNGNITISNIKLYYQLKNAGAYTRWSRGETTLTINGVTVASWGGYSNYTAESQTYSASFDSVVVNVGTGGGNINVSVNANVSYHTVSTSFSYTSKGSTTININPYVVPYSQGNLNIDKTSLILGEDINFTISGGNKVTYSINWSCLSQSGSTGLTDSGKWNVSISVFEPIIKNSDVATITFTLNSYANGSLIGTSSKSVNAFIPQEYVPRIEVNNFELLDAINDYLIMGTSGLKLYYDAYSYPSDSSATINSVSVYAHTEPEISVGIIGSVDINSITFNQFPVITDFSSYSLIIDITVEDSRKRKSTITVTSSTNIYNSNFGNVYGYVPPKIENIDIHRCNSNGQINPSGKYAYVSTTIISEDELDICSVEINYISYNLSLISGNNYGAIVGDDNLSISSQYEATLKVSNVKMTSYKDAPITKRLFLPTQKMPISLYDDGSQVGVSIGEMATSYGDVVTEAVLNFSNLVTLRATNEEGVVAQKKPYDLLTQSGEGAKIFVQTTSDIPSDMKDGDILIVYEA